MHAIRIIGSTELGWHPMDDLTADALMRFANFKDVFMFDVTIGGVSEAASTCYGYAICRECPFTLNDAHKVLEMIRPMSIELLYEQFNRRG